MYRRDFINFSICFTNCTHCDFFYRILIIWFIKTAILLSLCHFFKCRKFQVQLKVLRNLLMKYRNNSMTIFIMVTSEEQFLMIQIHLQDLRLKKNWIRALKARRYLGRKKILKISFKQQICKTL